MSATAPATLLQHWEESGGIWRILGARGDELTVSLCQCTGGEEVDRLVSADPDLRTYVAGRLSSLD